MILKYDCKHFPGDRPCVFHKDSGIKCDSCPVYSKHNYRILIIKLDAMGDVLRTTSILHPLKDTHPNSEIVWITKHESSEIFQNNKLVDKLLFFEDAQTIAYLLTQTFDLVINLDSSEKSSLLATLAHGNEKKGFCLNDQGKVYAVNPEAEDWLEMGAFDDIKRSNTKTYQQLMLDIIGLPDAKNFPIILNLDDEQKAFAADFSKKHDIDDKTICIGLNTGAGSRWKMKKWTLHGYEELIKKLATINNVKILLYGSELEKERNEKLKKISGHVVDTGSNNSLRQFFALLSLSHIVVTGDTLALHAALALGKRVIALFGPTSNNEIELYGRGDKIIPDINCLVCYLPDCDVERKCMDRIAVDTVYNAVQKNLKEL